MNVATLHQLCESSSPSGWKAMFRKPAWLILNNERHVAATNGRALLLTKGVDSMIEYMDKEYLAHVGPFFGMPVEGETISAGAVKQWSGPGVWETLEECLSCRGMGVKNSLHCPDCAGHGKVRAPGPGRLGMIRGVVINRNSVGCVMASVPDAEEVRVQAFPIGKDKGPMVVFSGETWRAWMMGMMGSPSGPELFPVAQEVRT